MKIGKRLEQQIKQFALEEHPNEACGIVTKIGKRLKAIKCRNIADTPKTNFVIGSDEYRHWLDTSGVYAIWHTHVDDSRPMTPSPTDRAACNMTAVDWIIIDLKTREDGNVELGELFFVIPEEIEEEPYVGRNYIYGVRDCFTLMADYYRRELGVTIDFRAPGYPEVSNWQEKGHNLLADSYEKAGFVRLIKQPALPGDLFLIQMGAAVPDHVALYLGDDKILHHLSGRLSTIDVYGGGFWQKHTTHHLRWNEFMEKQ
ncbi:MAG: NlpC/P60 family protein [Candidatus Binatia bacterium]